MPQAGDIIRTRYCIEQWGRNPYVTFWWKLLQWHPAQEPTEFILANAISWFATIDSLVDDTYHIRYGTFRNLTTREVDHSLSFSVTGQPKPEPVRVVHATLWVRRYGIDQSGDPRMSPLPLSNLVIPQRAGRVLGDGQLPNLNSFFVDQHTIISPLAPVWVGGFISGGDGSFVECLRADVNPVIKSLKTRTRKSFTREVFE